MGKRKVKLPTDRTGEPIHVGDVLQWDDGTRMQVATLTYYGKELESIGSWTAEGECEEYSDNLGNSIIVWRKGSE